MRRGAFHLPPQQRNLQCLSLRLGKLRERVGLDVLEEIAQPGEGKLRLRLDGAADQHTVRPFTGDLDRVLPERRLAYADVAVDAETDSALPNGVEKARDRVELSLASDDFSGLRRHRGSSWGLTAIVSS